MATIDIDALEPATRDILKAHTADIPVKLGALADALGLVVRVGTLKPGISGEIRPSTEAPAGFLIRINRHEKKERQRFTLAHEIGHYILHRHLIRSGITDDIMYRSGLSDQYESEANRFAAELLMPRAIVRERIKQSGRPADDELAGALAKEFQVSVPAMKIRLGVS